MNPKCPILQLLGGLIEGTLASSARDECWEEEQWAGKSKG